MSKRLDTTLYFINLVVVVFVFVFFFFFLFFLLLLFLSCMHNFLSFILPLGAMVL